MLSLWFVLLNSTLRNIDTNAAKVSALQSKFNRSSLFHNCDSDNDVLLSKLILEEIGATYDRKTVPMIEGVEVAVDVIVQAISSIDHNSGSLTTDLLYGQIWRDPGMRFDHKTSCLPNLTLSHDMLDLLWSPDVSFQNSLATKVHVSPTPNIFLLIYPNGTVWVNYRVKVRMPCELDMTTFPMDSQCCTLIFESYSFNAARVRLKWLDTGVMVFQSGRLADFELYKFIWKKEYLMYPLNGKWDQLKIKFYFRRLTGYYMIQLYLPTYASVFIRYLS